MTRNVAAIVQARTGSTRFPGKVLSNLCGKSMIEFLLDRLQQCEIIDHIILATTDLLEDDKLSKVVSDLGIDVVRGSENDVLSRFVLALDNTSATTIIRITGDNPILDPNLIQSAVISFINSDLDYLSNCFPPTYPDGLDVEVFTRAALMQAHEKCTSIHQREHVTPWIRESKTLSVGSFNHNKDLSSLRWTVDEPEDLQVISSIVSHFRPRIDFTWLDVVQLQQEHPNIFEANSSLSRNEGSSIGKGQKLWKRAKRVIPGGNMLLSKRSEMFLPDQWPAYFSRSSGCNVWDLDGNQYIDMSIMGIGTNILGYGHAEVDAAVCKSISDGNMSTLNCSEEVILAEQLINLHSWAEIGRAHV